MLGEVGRWKLAELERCIRQPFCEVFLGKVMGERRLMLRVSFEGWTLTSERETISLAKRVVGGKNDGSEWEADAVVRKMENRRQMIDCPLP